MVYKCVYLYQYKTIFLNAKNQEEKSEIDADNQLVECF